MATTTSSGEQFAELSLTVLLTEEDGGWFAQGLEIDYAACGSNLQEVKDNFLSGMINTMQEHMLLHKSLKHFLMPAPQEAWDAYYEAKNKKASVNNLNELKPQKNLLGDTFDSIKSMFPFEKIAFLDHHVPSC